jgi:hypothetical protein
MPAVREIAGKCAAARGAPDVITSKMGGQVGQGWNVRHQHRKRKQRRQQCDCDGAMLPYRDRLHACACRGERIIHRAQSEPSPMSEQVRGN